MARKVKKMSESITRPSGDDAFQALGSDVWQRVLFTSVTPKTSSADPLGAALSLIEINPEHLAPPPELTSGMIDRFQRTLELQKWRQDEELLSLARDVQTAEEHKNESLAMNAKHAQELQELKLGFETHYVQTRQAFLTERIKRVNQHELELADLKYEHLKKTIVKPNPDEVRDAEIQLATQQEAEYASLNQLFNSKKQQILAMAASLIPSKAGMPAAQLQLEFQQQPLQQNQPESEPLQQNQQYHRQYQQQPQLSTQSSSANIMSASSTPFASSSAAAIPNSVTVEPLEDHEMENNQPSSHSS